jgi:hypothetical protein
MGGEAYENMVTHFRVLLDRSLLWLALAAGALYVRMVVMRHCTDGPYCCPSLQLRDPVRSAQRIGVWLGVKALEGLLRIARLLLNMLLEASAEVGDSYLRRRTDMLEKIRSRFHM